MERDWQLPCGCARFTGTEPEPRLFEHGFYCGLARRWRYGRAFFAFDRLEAAWVEHVLSIR